MVVGSSISLVLVLSGCTPDAVHVTPPNPSTNAQEQACAHLGDFLPAKLEKLKSRVITPKSPLTHAWGKPPITLQCGVAAPPGFDPKSSETAVVDNVDWYEQLTSADQVWTAIRPGANVRLTIPASYDVAGAYLVDLADPLKHALP